MKVANGQMTGRTMDRQVAGRESTNQVRIHRGGNGDNRLSQRNILISETIHQWHGTAESRASRRKYFKEFQGSLSKYGRVSKVVNESSRVVASFKQI